MSNLTHVFKIYMAHPDNFIHIKDSVVSKGVPEDWTFSS